MKERLSKFIAAEGISPSILADEMGVHRTGISHILIGRNNASYDFIKRLLERFPKLNAEWLILGQGQMYKSSVETTTALFPDEKTSLSPTLPPEKPKILPPVEDVKNIPVEKISEILPSAELKKRIEKMIIIYSDRTFATYMPEEL